MRKIAFILLFYIATTAVYAQTSTYQLSSHTLDVSTGMPAKGVPVKLEKLVEKAQMWKQVDKKITDENGSVKDFLDYNKAETGI